MSNGEIILDQNAAAVEAVSGNSSGAEIDQAEFKALAEVKTLEGEEGRAADAGNKSAAVGGASEGSILAGIAAEAAVPGLKVLSTIGEFVSERGSDMAQQGFSAQPQRGRTDGITAGNARTFEQDIRSANRAAGSYGAAGDIVSRANNAVNSLFGRAATDKMSDGLVGGSGKKNAMHIPADQSTAQGLNQSMEKIFGKKMAHKNTLDSVYAARMERSAALGRAQQMAPGMDLSSGPRFNANEILAEAERYKETVAGTVTG